MLSMFQGKLAMKFQTGVHGRMSGKIFHIAVDIVLPPALFALIYLFPILIFIRQWKKLQEELMMETLSLRKTHTKGYVKVSDGI
jgi:hypothetical protein